MPSRSSAPLALLTALALGASGCAAMVAQPQRVAVDLERPEFADFTVARGLTSMERESRLEQLDANERGTKAVPAVFWTGIVLGSLGAVGTVGFAVAGRVTKDRLNDLYSEDSGSLEDRNDLRERGETWNTLVITSGLVMATGFSVALIAYAIDWNRCGALAPKKRRCKEAGLAK